MYFKPSIVEMKAYHPPLSGRLSSGQHLLDFNERVTPVCAKVQEAMARWVQSGQSWCYPEYEGLCESLASYGGVGPENVFFGNGSDQLLDVFFRAVVSSDDAILLPSPSFAMYKQCAQLVEGKIEQYSMLSPDPLSELLSTLEQGDVRLVVICNPNNPTGTLLDPFRLKQIFEKFPETWFLVDEAYVEFSGSSVVGEGAMGENVVVTRTFSKAFGLASLRFGFLMGSEKLIEQLGKIRGPYDVNVLAAVAAKASLENLDDIRAYAKEVMEEAKPLVESALIELGCSLMPSWANYVLMEPPQGLTEHLEAHGIRIRKMSQEELSGRYRMSIGNLKSAEQTVSALKQFT
jgi:histidinol-phosphate aminotransferase